MERLMTCFTVSHLYFHDSYPTCFQKSSRQYFKMKYERFLDLILFFYSDNLEENSFLLKRICIHKNHMKNNQTKTKTKNKRLVTVSNVFCIKKQQKWLMYTFTNMVGKMLFAKSEDLKCCVCTISTQS